MARFDTKRFAKAASPAFPRRTGFVRSEDGSFIIFGLMIFLLMLIVGGLGVDFMRFEAQRARLQATLDRAVLAAASMDQPLDPEQVVLDYFTKAGLGDYINAEDIHVTNTLTSRRVEASARMGVQATLLQFAGIHELVAPAAGAAEESASQTEISLVLDVSGSMAWASDSGNSKIYELRQAAKRFVNIVLCDPAYPDRTTPCTVEAGKVSVSLVPYSEQATVGEDLLMMFNPTAEHHYSSCVTFAAGDYGSTTITPEQQLQRTGHFDPWTTRSSNAAGPDDNRTCQTDTWREFTPVSGDAQRLRDRIDLLGASGNTSIDIGMKWGAAFLDPAAQPVVTDLITAGRTSADYDGRPLDWDERGVEKVIVLMTDGVNTDQHYLYDGFRSGLSPIYRDIQVDAGGNEYEGNHWSILDTRNTADTSDDRYWWEDTSEWKDHPYGAGTYQKCTSSWVREGGRWVRKETCTDISEGSGARQLDFVTLWNLKPWVWWDKWSWLPNQGSQYGNATKNARLQTMCNAAKAENITIFSVGFEVTTDSAAVMRACASSPAHYFNATGLDLSAAFAAIAREISKLRLVN